MSGIETLKKNLGTILTIIKKTDEALEDNKLSIVEAFGIGLTGLKAWGIWKEYTESTPLEGNCLETSSKNVSTID